MPKHRPQPAAGQAELKEGFLERPFAVGTRDDLELSCLWTRRRPLPIPNP